MAEDGGDTKGSQGATAPVESAAGSPASGSAVSPGPYSGTTTIDAKMDFEVQVLGVASLRCIAAEIAGRVAARLQAVPRSAVIVADAALAAAIADWRIVAVRIAGIADALDALVFELEPADVTESPLGGVGETVKAIADLLSWFKVDTTYYGRTVDLGDALNPALLGQLLAAGIEPVALGGAASGSVSGADSGTLLGSLRRLLLLREKVLRLTATRATEAARAKATGPAQAKAQIQTLAGPASADQGGASKPAPAAPAGGDPLEAKDPAAASPAAEPAQDPPDPAPDPLAARAKAAAEAADALLAELAGNKSDGTRLGQLLAASEACAIADAAPDGFLLEAKVLKAGGHYRERKHLLATFFGLNQVTYGAGASVAFTLTDMRRGRIVLADVLFHAIPNTLFPSRVSLPMPTNLGHGAAGSGFAVLGIAPVAPPAAAAVPATGERQPSVNAGDDAEAEAGDRSVTIDEDALESAAWRLAASLGTLRSQINAKAPGRNKASDGSIGDAAHQSRDSDHNPWVRDGEMGVVTAIDVTNDPAHGCSAELLAETLRASRDRRLKYVIWNRRIASAAVVDGAQPWAWRPYGGENPHNKHIHISVQPDKALYDSTEAWRI